MLVRAPNGSYEFIDFRETAPAAAFEDMYKNNEQASITGGLASGVPGEVRGLQRLHENYGKLPWATVLKPAVKVAREGWRVNEDLVKYMASATSGNLTSNFLVNDLEFALDFAPKGRLLKLNETITRKRYANTLETIANEGPDAFYHPRSPSQQRHYDSPRPQELHSCHPQTLHHQLPRLQTHGL
jgi:gamma-glutamyltranspeptidase/glutathione hydrolase